MYHISENDWGQTVIHAGDRAVVVYSTFEASGRIDSQLATLEAGEAYTLDHMLSYFGNWTVMDD